MVDWTGAIDIWAFWWPCLRKQETLLLSSTHFPSLQSRPTSDLGVASPRNFFKMVQNYEATRLFNWPGSRQGQPLLYVGGTFAVFLTSFV